jgi:ribosomal-protein-alanine N-acetyltransferase
MSSRPQVRLVPATVPLLHALNDDPAEFEELIGSSVPEGWPEFPEAIGFTLAHLESAPEGDRSWSMQFFVDEATGRLVGSGGFAAPPVGRTVEIGYEVAPEFRGQRFGVEAARALVDKAVASGEVDHVIAHTMPGPKSVDGRPGVARLRARRRPGGSRGRHRLGMEVGSVVGRVGRAQPAHGVRSTRSSANDVTQASSPATAMSRLAWSLSCF